MNKKVSGVTSRTIVLLVLYAFLSNTAVAGPLLEIEKNILGISEEVWSGLLLDGMKIFYILVIIDFSWSMISLFLDGEKISLGDVVAELLRQIMVIALFKYILVNGWEFTQAILDSIKMSYVPKMASNTGDGLIQIGINYFTDALSGVSWFSSDAITLFICGAIVVLCLAYIAVTITLVKVELAIVLATSGLIAGLSGTRWTRDYSITYLKYAVSVGIKLLLMNLIAGEMLSIVQRAIANSVSENLIAAFIVIAVAFGACILIKSIPDIIAGILQGVSVGNQGAAVARGGQMAMNSAKGGISGTATAAGGAIGATIAIAQAAKFGAESARQDSGNGNGGSLKGIGGKAFKAGAKALAGETGKQVLNNITKSAESKHGSTSSRVSDGLKAKTEALKTQGMDKPYTSPAPDLTKK